MSIQAMTETWSLDINPTSKLVLLSLADHVNEDGICWPSLKLLSKKCGLTYRSVVSHIKNLCDIGVITKSSRYDKSGNQRSNIYRFNFLGISHQQSGEKFDKWGVKEVQEGVKEIHPYKNHKDNHKCISTGGKKITEKDCSNNFNYHKLTKNKKRKLIKSIFIRWAKIMNRPNARLDNSRKTAIHWAFTMGYTEDQIMSAIHGCSKSEFHMGKNKNNALYNDITTILKDSVRVESFMAMRASKCSVIDGNAMDPTLALRHAINKYPNLPESVQRAYKLACEKAGCKRNLHFMTEYQALKIFEPIYHSIIVNN